MPVKPLARGVDQTARWKYRYQKVLDAAATAFAEKGYKTSSINDIADLLGVRSASLYYYFPSKEAALAAVCESGVTAFIANLSEAIEKHQSSAERIRAAKLSDF